MRRITLSLNTVLLRATLLLTISFAAFAQDNVITVKDIRMSIGANTTRMVFDTDKPVPYTATKKIETQKLEIELPGVIFQSLPTANQISNSAIASVDIIAADGDKPAKIIIYLRRRMIVSVKPYEPKGHYGHRLVMDFIKLNKMSSTPEPLQIRSSENSDTDKLFIDGQQALASGEYANALSIYQRLMDNKNPEVRRKALEYYAVSLEQSGKKARAKLEYNNYLKRYPGSEGEKRVQQRLNAMLSLEKGTRKLTATKRSTDSGPAIETWGVFFEDYRWSQITNDEGESDTRLNSAYTMVDANARLRTQDWELSMRVNGGYQANFLSGGEDKENLSYLYAYGEHRSTERSMKLGRQRQHSGGTIGRFDGISLSSPITDSVRLNLVAGFPVERSTNTSVDTDRSFYGINADIGPFFDELEFNVFYIDQEFDGFTDREAVGGEVKYFGSDYYLSGYFDYDVHFNELNAFLLNGRYQFSSGTNASLSLNFRKSPYLTTRNALIGQQLDDLNDLKDRIDGLEELEDIALDRTFDSTSLNLYVDHPINNKINISTSLTVSELSDTPSSAGVAGYEGTDTEFHFNSQIVVNDMLFDRDNSRVGFTYATLTHSDIYSVYSHYKYQLSDNWRLYPRLAFQTRDNHDNTGQDRYSLLLRTEFKFLKDHRLDGQIGADWYFNDNRFGEQDELTIYFFNVGYTYLF
jgi:hypothetical protein